MICAALLQRYLRLPRGRNPGNVFEDNLYHVVFHKKRFDVQKLMAEEKWMSFIFADACEELYRHQHME